MRSVGRLAAAAASRRRPAPGRRRRWARRRRPTGRRPGAGRSCPRRRAPSWNVDQRGEVEVGEHVAVDHDEALVDAGVAGGEADGAGGVERLGLDGVVEPHPGADAVGVGRREGVGPEAERQHRLVDAVAAEVRRARARSSAGRRSAASASGWPTSAAGAGCRSPRPGRRPASARRAGGGGRLRRAVGAPVPSSAEPGAVVVGGRCRRRAGRSSAARVAGAVVARSPGVDLGVLLRSAAAPGGARDRRVALRARRRSCRRRGPR